MHRRLLIIAAAFVLAVLSAIAVAGYTSGSDRRALQGRKGTWVLLATGTVKAGTSVSDIRKKRLYRQVLMPAETVPSGALTQLPATMNGQHLNADLQRDQMLLRGQFQTTAIPKPTPTFRIPKGKLGVSVALGIATQVAGNVDPGDKITVFCTYPKETDTTNKIPAKTFPILMKVQVITVGEAPEATPTGATPSLSVSNGVTVGPTVLPSASAADISGLDRYVVTLAVDQPQAQALINASHTCDLHVGVLGANATVTPVPSYSELTRITS
jgi:pilus assembly protein CpaB